MQVHIAYVLSFGRFVSIYGFRRSLVAIKTLRYPAVIASLGSLKKQTDARLITQLNRYDFTSPTDTQYSEKEN